MSEERLGQQLCANGLIDSDQLRIALIEQQQRHRPLGQLISELGFADERGIGDTLSRQLRLERFDPLRHAASPDAISRLPADAARRHRILPLEILASRRRWRVAMSTPQDPQALASIHRHAPPGMDTDILFAMPGEIEHGIDLHYGSELAIDRILDEVEGKHQAQLPTAESPAVRLVDALLNDAVRRRASDIHFEPEQASLRIRYRIDGLLTSIRLLHRSLWPALSSRIKVIAGMDIAETRAPQDGHLRRQIAGRDIDFRVASHPVLHGESLVLRILDRQKGIVPLAALGASAEQLNCLEQMLTRPSGLLVVTGPTGSGKTTTLYSLLNRLRSETTNIMTLEDPVEYPLPLMRQTSLSDNIKMGFAEGVRSMLRQDPDIMLIGEIRDAETAAMSLRAALTGHQVFATLHAGNAFSALSRLAELGISSNMLHSNLTGIVAQRLIRRLCPSCQGQRPASPAEAELFGLDALPTPGKCDACSQRGYLGRMVLMEILRIDHSLDQLLARDAAPPDLLIKANANGFRNMTEQALALVRQGETSPEEIARAVDLSEWQ